MRSVPRPTFLGLLVLSAAWTAACDDTASPGPRNGSLEIAVEIEGAAPYLLDEAIRVDDGPLLPLNEGLTRLPDLPPGTYALFLRVAPNCTVAGDNPRHVTVLAAQATGVSFAVNCEPALGSLRVSASTTGAHLDADGYVLSLGPDMSGHVDTNGVVTLEGIPAGVLSVDIEGVAVNCELLSSRANVVNIEYRGEARIDVLARCRPAGTLLLTTQTMGVDPDPNGYRVTFEMADLLHSVDLSVAGDHEIQPLPAGEYAVTLSGVAANCDIAAPWPHAGATVTADVTTPLTLEVSCVSDTQVAYISGIDIWVINSNGTASRRLLHQPPFAAAPQWSPDGSRIVYQGLRDGNADLYAASADGSGEMRLTEAAEPDRQPAWSPDGSRVAFVRELGSNAEVFVMDADGSDVRRLTDSPSTDTDPAWSPDGSTIAFTSDRDGADAIFTMNPDGTEVSRLSGDGTDSEPAWSPDGTRLAFSRLDCGESLCVPRIVVRTLADGTEVPLTEGTSPAWSPDGRKLAYLSMSCSTSPWDYYGYGCSNQGIGISRVDGTMHDLVVSGDAHDPTWRR